MRRDGSPTRNGLLNGPSHRVAHPPRFPPVASHRKTVCFKNLTKHRGRRTPATQEQGADAFCGPLPPFDPSPQRTVSGPTAAAPSQTPAKLLKQSRPLRKKAPRPSAHTDRNPATPPSNGSGSSMKQNVSTATPQNPLPSEARSPKQPPEASAVSIAPPPRSLPG